MSDERYTALLTMLDARARSDQRWGRLHFLWAQIFTWLAVLASFFSAILVAADAVPSLVLAFVAAIPGTVIVIEKSFSFSKRARWHWEMLASVDRLRNALLFENAPVEEISRKLGELRVEMEAKFPSMTVEGLSDR